jgi:type IV pilus assembly protein PilB
VGVLTEELEQKVTQLIVEEGLADPSEVSRITEVARGDGKPLLATLVSENVVSQDIVVHVTAVAQGVRYVNLKNVRLDQSVLLWLPSEVAQRSMAVPLGEKDGQVYVAVLDASNIQMVDYLTTLLKKPVKAVVASEDSINYALSEYKADFSDVDRASKEEEQAVAVKEASDVKTITQDSPISKALTTILEYAGKSKASDIHIEPLEDMLIIRCRIDGVLRKVMELPKSIEAALVSRIKILANLKIDEHRIPQDGQFTVMVGDKEIDLRIAISPVVWGEQVVIRLLDKTGVSSNIEKRGVVGRALRAIRAGIEKPNGMVLTSGPTGSGKSTTLYALIKEIKDESINIVTLEDPVEYKMGGINQIQVNTDAGLTFASGLRSILRQDPDVVMVGEIRDAETANLAVQAALTGHLVFSTLHTNSAAGILPRLLDMDIEPFLIASTLNTVIGQRLVRRVAEKRETFLSNSVQTEEVREVVGHILPRTKEDVVAAGQDLGYENLPVADSKAFPLVKGVEAPDAPGGYVGRAGIYEAFEVDEDIQKLIVARATAAEVKDVAMEKGMISMRQDGMLKSLTGLTTIDEVNRVASDIA